MEQISKLIQKYDMTQTEDQSQGNTQTNESLFFLEPTNINEKNLYQNYKRGLVIAKIIISELQDKNIYLTNHNSELEIQLNEALETIKSLHKDYINLTEKFSHVNQSFEENSNDSKMKKLETEKNDLLEINNKLQKDLKESNEKYQININKLNDKILQLQNHINELEKKIEESERKNNDVDIEKLEIEITVLKGENSNLKKLNIELNNKYNSEINKLKLEIEKLKGQISLNENKIKTLSVEIKEKEIEYQKQVKLNEQYNTLDQQFTFSIQEKDKNYNMLNEQYSNLFNEYKVLKNQMEKNRIELEEKIKKYYNERNNLMQKVKEYKIKLTSQSEKNSSLYKKQNDNKYDLLLKQKDYIQGLLLRIHPNANLIQQIIELNKELIQLEFQKFDIAKKIAGENNSNLTVKKIDKQINLFKLHLKKLEEELAIDLGNHGTDSGLISSSSMFQYSNTDMAF